MPNTNIVAPAPVPVVGANPVNRSRRTYFIFAVVGFCLFAATLLTGLAAWGIIVAQIPLVTLFIESLFSLAGIATLAYVGGSSVDYNGGIANMFSRRNPTAVITQPNQYYAPQAAHIQPNQYYAPQAAHMQPLNNAVPVEDRQAMG
jgi:phosphoglycerol transferase MdoB-like AlkP superfamily enzyme